MKNLFLFLGILYGFSCMAQGNDYQDTRRKTESFSRLQPKDIRTDVATFALSGISESVGALPLQKISYNTFSKDSMTFEGDGIKATINISNFDPAKHKLTYDEKYLIRINRKTYYGGYGSIPKTYISNVSMTIGNDTVLIPPSAYFDLYNLNLTYNDKGVKRTTNAIYKSKDGHRIYWYLFSKDNTGSYEVTWIIQDHKYLRRVLDYGFM
ncbi:MAG: hypothetical protein Q8891_11230 [Bacteroidota bacterium]|nr:hypothetical protein [Bacteroidota bacterium]